MATYAVNLASGTTDEKGILRLLGMLLSTSGVLKSTALQVTAQGTPTMQLNISGSAAADDAVFITTNGDTYHGWNTTQTTVTIAANSTGNTMIDSVVAYINLGAGIATANNPGGLVFTSVRGAAANTAPTSAAIQAAVGSNNPYIELAHITVGNGVSSINSGNITDVRVLSGIAALAIGSTYINPVISLQALGANTGAPGSVKIAETILGSAQASVTFSSIPQVYRSLRLVWMGRGDAGAEQAMGARPNSDAGSNYELQEFNSTGTSMVNTYTGTLSYASIGDITSTNSTANYFNMGETLIPFYASTSNQKLFLSDYFRRHTSTTGNLYRNSRYAAWKSTAAITSLTIFPVSSGNFVAGSSFALYGEP